MKDAELSVKTKLDGTCVDVYLIGAPDDLIINFCVLADSLCKQTHFPPAAIAMLVVQCREITEKITESHIGIDLSALRRSAEEK